MSRRRRKRRRRKEPPTLFDLPLHLDLPEDREDAPEPVISSKSDLERDKRTGKGKKEIKGTPRAKEELNPEAKVSPSHPESDPHQGKGREENNRPSGALRAGKVSRRCVAGLMDLLLPALTVLPLLGWTMRLGGALSPESGLALGGLYLLISYIYHTVAIAFWGQTPGMKYQDLRVRSGDGKHPSLGQVTRRWWGGLLALLPLGLGCLWLFSGASWADRLSGTRVIVASDPEHC